jgi:hypothetical protein
MIRLIAVAVAAYTSTNIDDLLLLCAFCAHPCRWLPESASIRRRVKKVPQIIATPSGSVASCPKPFFPGYRTDGGKTAERQTTVKAVSRRRRGPKARLYSGLPLSHNRRQGLIEWPHATSGTI